MAMLHAHTEEHKWIIVMQACLGRYLFISNWITVYMCNDHFLTTILIQLCE